MSKTLEVVEDAVGYRVVSPDHDEEWEVEGYSLDVERGVLVEAGALRIDAEPDEEYFHVEETYNGNHVEISVESQQQGPQEYVFPYTDDYTLAGKVEQAGIPDTEQARKSFKYLPFVELVMEYDNTGATPVAVKVDGTRYELE